jgi:hypothetical protein
MWKDEETANAHWSGEDLLDKLYGLEPRPAAHPLESCPECGARWQALLARRQAVLAVPAVPESRLRAQRAAVFARLETVRRGWIWRAVPATAVALVLAAGVSLHAPRPTPPAREMADAGLSDAQLFSEIALLSQQETPAAAEPLRALFSEAAEGEVK